MTTPLPPGSVRLCYGRVPHAGGERAGRCIWVENARLRDDRGAAALASDAPTAAALVRVASCDSVAVNVPGGLNAGSYTLFAEVDDLGVVTESNESNNTRAADTGMINLGFNACPSDLVLENQTLTGTQTLEATSSATLGPSLTVDGTNIVVNAPTVSILGNTSINGPFSVGTNPSCL